jgi:hypothetical protein
MLLMILAGPVATLGAGCGSPLRAETAKASAPTDIEQRADAKTRSGESTTLRSPEEQENFDLLSRLNDRISARLAASGYQALTAPEKTVYVVWELEAEVDNGGFDQYFYNSAGDRAVDAPAALDRIGAPRTAALAREAIAKFPAPGLSRDRFVRQKQLLTLSPSGDAFNALDERFYECPEDLEKLLAAYARDNATELPSARRFADAAAGHRRAPGRLGLTANCLGPPTTPWR